MSGETAFASPVHYSSGVDHTYEIASGSNQYGNLPPFQFRKRTGDINWRKLGNIDVDRVARELDFVTLQEYIVMVTFCNIDSVSDLDPLFVKLFRLGQYTIEYLLHSQEYLQSIIESLEGQLEEAGSNKQSMEERITELTEEIIKVKQENKKRRKIIEQQQMLIEAGASSYYQCPHCEKAFMNASFLQGHMQRRHPGSVNYIGDVIAHSQREQGKLGSQLQQLESDLQSERENFHSKLKQAEEDKLRWAEQSRREMDEWKVKEEARWREELNVMKESFIADISHLKLKEEDYQQTINDLQRTMDQRHSNLGDLVDDIQEEKTKLRDYEGRVISLEERNDDKNRQIDELSTELKRLRLEQQTSLKNQKNSLLDEQERKLEALRKQMERSSATNKLQMDMFKLGQKKKETKPKEVYVPEVNAESTVVADSKDRDAMKREMAAHIRQNLLPSILDDELLKCGVDPAASGISLSTLTNKLMVFKTQRQLKAKQIPQYYQVRELLRRDVDDAMKKKSSGQLKLKKKKSAASVESRSKLSPQPQRRPRASSTPVRRDSPEKKATALKFSSEVIMTDSVRPSAGERPKPSSTKGERTSSAKKSTSMTKKSPSVSKQQLPVALPRHKRDDEESPWDSGEDTDGAPPSKKSDTDDIDDILSSDGNETKLDGRRNVKNLRKNLEQQLRYRKRPPAGAVDVSPKLETKVEKFELTDDDDDDSFLVSSMEENAEKPNSDKHKRPSSSKTPAVGGSSRKSAPSTSNTYGTSIWGSGQKGTKDQTQDDSDWDDLELEEILT